MVSIKHGLRTGYKTQTRHKKQATDFVYNNSYDYWDDMDDCDNFDD